MLDWMKKLFKKEEENEAPALRAIETPAEKKVTSQIPRVNYYSNKRQDELQTSKSYSGGKFRFPLIPDDGFDESTQEPFRLEKPAIQERPIREQHRSRRVEEVQEMTYMEPSIEKVKSTSRDESNRRPFRPSEMVSPIFGYNRPEPRQKANEESNQQQQEDIEISMEGKSVVDAWLEKNGYISSGLSQDGLTEQNQAEPTIVKADAEQTESSKSIVDTWLEKNGATLHNHEEEQLDMSEDVIVRNEDFTQQIHIFESEGQKPTVIETSFEMNEEIERIEESVTEEVMSEVSFITEEPVMEEAPVEAEESAEMEEPTEEKLLEEVMSEVSFITEEPVMEEAPVEAEESAEMEEPTEEELLEEVMSEVSFITEEPVMEEAPAEAEESAEIEKSTEENYWKK
ncbi:hypothetical protein [Bacillus bruguierae]|uniref:hypothetical protein n=1 Tax=Bacillus bruguierae TaxID=3127667 RepID=UPI0039B74076